MKLAQLRYLTAIVEAGFNISAAADKLHLSQPGVSRQLRLLEEELIRDQQLPLRPLGQSAKR